jgi:hypothetical protein
MKDKNKRDKKQKKGSAALVAMLVLVVIAVIFLKSNPQALESAAGGMGNIFNFTVNVQNGQQDQGQSQPEVVVQKVDICNLMLPYTVAFGNQANCEAAGGAWHCNDHDNGCYNFAGTINCANGYVQTALYQCRQVGATAFCDAHNVYCRY